ncbi:Cu_bind_like domain-containing protein [Cephalotus follicularis]|uniref:Cu_bind_like domain-containing protein n=1 Tax=Cephalotus follicularis TaxID=3775 RepID=A0A1Q3CQG2_CEPFO|nr:Cu_bind_like domain-containing protein [Cephalotus follicularis]
MAGILNMVFLVAIAINSLLLLQGSTAQTVHVVGDGLGWVIPPNGAAAYTTWAANKTFTVGDILVFNFATGRHDVAQVTKANFDSCNTNSPISLTSTSPANITLSAVGEHNYICNFTGHCSSGQKLAINVSASSSTPTIPSPVPVQAPAPQTIIPSPVPVSAPGPQPRTPSQAPAPGPAPSTIAPPAPAPSSSSMTFTVGDSLGWTVPSNGAIAYQTWARGKTFRVGDALVFNYVNGSHDVAEVTKQDYESCNTSTTLSLNSNPPTIITLSTSGEHFYICTVGGHCSAGQSLAINVTDGTTAMSPPTAAAPSTPTNGATPPPPSNSAISLGVAGLLVAFLSIFLTLLNY